VAQRLLLHPQTNLEGELKMKQLLMAGAALVAATAFAPLAHATAYSYNFVDYYGDSLSSLPGVNFSLAGGPGAGGTPSVNSFGQPALGNSPTGEYPTSQQLVFSFTGAATDISFLFSNFGDNNSFGAPTEYYAYSAADVLVSSGNIGSDNDVTENVPGSGITKLVVDNGTGGGSSWEFGVYTLNFTASAPEPASLALVGVGLAGLGLIRRRKAR
jgi:hypothetical protein